MVDSRRTRQGHVPRVQEAAEGQPARRADGVHPRDGEAGTGRQGLERGRDRRRWPHHHHHDQAARTGRRGRGRGERRPHLRERGTAGRPDRRRARDASHRCDVRRQELPEEPVEQRHSGPRPGRVDVQGVRPGRRFGQRLQPGHAAQRIVAGDDRRLHPAELRQLVVRHREPADRHHQLDQHRIRGAGKPGRCRGDHRRRREVGPAQGHPRHRGQPDVRAGLPVAAAHRHGQLVRHLRRPRHVRRTHGPQGGHPQHRRGRLPFRGQDDPRLRRGGHGHGQLRAAERGQQRHRDAGVVDRASRGR